MDRPFKENAENEQVQPKKDPIPVRTDFSSINPLQALKDSVKKTVRQGEEEEKPVSAPTPTTPPAKKPVKKKNQQSAC